MGYWASDCATQWCLPGTDVDFFYSENLGKSMTATADILPAYVATIEASDTHCGPDITPYRVWRLDPNVVYLGMLRPMIDPVRFCSGSKCDQVIYQGWVVAHPELVFYFPVELSLSDIGQIVEIAP